MFSVDLFDFGEGIFSKKVMDEERNQKRSTSEEYYKTKEQIISKGGFEADASPERINKIIRKLPPFEADDIP